MKELPTLLELASYTWFVPQSALGVFFEFSDYKRFIERSHEFKSVPVPIVASLMTLAQAIFCTVVFLVFRQYFWIEFCYTPEYADFSLLSKTFYFFVAMAVKKFFYYGPFLFTTGAF